LKHRHSVRLRLPASLAQHHNPYTLSLGSYLFSRCNLQRLMAVQNVQITAEVAHVAPLRLS